MSSEAAQKVIPLEDNPTIRNTVQRMSNKNRGLNPIDEKDGESQMKLGEQLNYRLTKGGHGGGLNKQDTNWVYFPNSFVTYTTLYNFLPSEERRSGIEIKFKILFILEVEKLLKKEMIKKLSCLINFSFKGKMLLEKKR